MASFATRLEMTKQEVSQFFSKHLQVVEYGRARRLEGGDHFQAHSLISHSADGWDMAFIRVSSISSPANAEPTNGLLVPTARRHPCAQEEEETRISTRGSLWPTPPTSRRRYPS